MTTIPDHVGREAVRLLNADFGSELFEWPKHREHASIITVAKLLMNPPAPMTDPDEESAKRVVSKYLTQHDDSFLWDVDGIARATEQMRKEFAARKEAWEAGR